MDGEADCARALMHAFAVRTGLEGEAPPRRYLWTDAFAVCNFLALHDLGRAARLVEQVHHVLGRERDDAPRHGWLGGRDEVEGVRHPTAAGLRIGKPLPERRAGEPYDAALEWERDGQYFHYLTRWMHALDRYARAAREPEAARWARELACAAHAGCVRAIGGRRGIAWKMSIGLDRPQVPATGQHDALDGLVTALQLQAHRPPDAMPDLAALVHDYTALCAGADWSTDDALGLGGLLVDAWRLGQLPPAMAQARIPLLATMLEAAHAGLHAWCARQPLRQPLARRLAFRELGLAIGLQALARMATDAAAAPVFAQPALEARVQPLQAFVPLGTEVLAQWREPGAQAITAWRAHEDINAVMLATGLVPAGYLDAD